MKGLHLQGFLASPTTRHYPFRYRDAAAYCTSATFNDSSALEAVWVP